MKRRSAALFLVALWMTSCTPASGLATSMPSTSAVYMPTVTQTAPYPLDLLVGVKSETAPSSPWTPPSLEQAQAGLGGSVPEGVSEQMAVYERQAGLRMPGVTLESVWNNLAGNSSRIATFGRDRNKNIVWSEKAGGSSFNEYPIGWYYDANGALQVNLDQKFGAVPDSQTAAVVFAGEKPVPVKEIVTLANGQEFFLQYFDIQTGEWQLNPAVLAAMAPQGYTVSQDANGAWLASAIDKQQLKFDLTTHVWVEALPPLPDKLAARISNYEIATTTNGNLMAYEKGKDPNAADTLKTYAYNIEGKGWVWDEVINAYTVDISETVMGVPINVLLVTEQSLPVNKLSPVNKVELNPAFGKNIYGETPSQAFARVTAEAIWLMWRDNGSDTEKASRAAVSFADFMALWKKNIGVTVRVYADDFTTPGYNPEYIEVTNPTIDVVLINPRLTTNVVENIRPESYRYAKSGQAIGTQVIKDHIRIYFGFPGDVNFRAGQSVVGCIIEGLARLSWPQTAQGEIIPDKLSPWTNTDTKSWQRRMGIDLGNSYYKAIFSVTPSEDPWNN